MERGHLSQNRQAHFGKRFGDMECACKACLRGADARVKRRAVRVEFRYRADVVFLRAVLAAKDELQRAGRQFDEVAANSARDHLL